MWVHGKPKKWVPLSKERRFGKRKKAATVAPTTSCDKALTVTRKKMKYQFSQSLTQMNLSEKIRPTQSFTSSNSHDYLEHVLTAPPKRVWHESFQCKHYAFFLGTLSPVLQRTVLRLSKRPAQAQSYHHKWNNRTQTEQDITFLQNKVWRRQKAQKDTIW